MSENYNLFLDDERTPKICADIYKDNIYTDLDWFVVRNYQQFREAIFNKGLPNIISFDHDLADEHYKEGQKSNFTEFNYNDCKEKTGLDCARFLKEYCKENNLELPTCYIHSFNPVGRRNIINELNN